MSAKYGLGVEIGAGDRYSSELLNRADEFEKIELYEPNEILYNDLFQLEKPSNVSIYSYAISDFSGGIPLYNFGYCSFLDCAKSFLVMSCEDDAKKYWESLINYVGSQKMSSLDEGNIDYLILTCQGSEMFVLNDMVSRPRIIRTKYYCHNAKHWEYYNQIGGWMDENGYLGTLLDKSQHNTYFHIEFKKNG